MVIKKFSSTKEYLQQISRLDRTIKNKLTELSQIRELTFGLKGILSEEKVQTSPEPDCIGSAYCKIDEMENNLNNLIDEYTDARNLIISQIDSMEDEVYYDILFSRYIEKNTFEKIAARMNYSFRSVTRLHGKALQAFEKKYGDTYLEKLS